MIKIVGPLGDMDLTDLLKKEGKNTKITATTTEAIIKEAATLPAQTTIGLILDDSYIVHSELGEDVNCNDLSLTLQEIINNSTDINTEEYVAFIGRAGTLEVDLENQDNYFI